MSVEIQLSVLLIPYALSAVLTLGLTIYGVAQLRNDTWDKTTVLFIGIVFSTSIWSIARFFEFLFVSESLTLFWIAVLYIGFGGGTMFGLFFCLEYTGRGNYVTPRYVALILVVPVLAVGVAATNSVHELFWIATYERETGWWGTIIVMNREFQPGFMLYLLYSVGGAVIGLLLLVRMAISSPSVYRNQTIAFTVGAILPISLGVMFVTENTPFMPQFIDLTPVGFALMGLCFGYAIFRHQMLDLVPVARDTVIENMRDGYIVVDTELRIVDFNNAAKGILEVDDEAVGDTIDVHLPEAMSTLSDHKHQTRTEAEIAQTIDAEEHFLQLAITSLESNGQKVGRLLLLRDITDQRAVRKRYQALIENSSDLTLVVERDGTISYASPSIEAIAGVDPEFVLDKDLYQFIHEDDVADVRAEFDNLAETPGAQRRLEFRLESAGDQWLFMEASVRNLFDNPFVEGIVVNARDITERKRREQDLRETNAELERSNNQLEQFASVISHDLRNPINVARGHLDLVRETDREESYDKIEHSLGRMEAIIEDVLTLAKEGESIGDTEPVELEDRAVRAWEHVNTEAATLEIGDPGQFEADPDRILQLFENLFRNAHEHVGSDVTVTVGLENGSMYVEDDGPGIPEDRRDKVLESGHTTNDDGTGLGLSIVSQIAEAHDWDVAVTEGTSGGARFEFHGIERVSESTSA